MERSHPPPPVTLPSCSKMERRIIEKNRRNHMKSLYSELHSLLPSYNSKEVLTVPDQIDEAVQHIKRLQVRLEKMKEKKENLLRQKRPRSCIKSEENEKRSSRLPHFEIQEMGPAMDVVLISGLDKPASFYSVLSSLDEEGFEIVNANFSSSGNSMIQVAHAKVGKLAAGHGATTVERRLNEVIYGYPESDQQSGLALWDFEIEPDIWGSGILETMPPLGAEEFSILNRA